MRRDDDQEMPIIRLQMRGPQPHGKRGLIRLQDKLARSAPDPKAEAEKAERRK